MDASTTTVSVSEDISGVNVPCYLLVGTELMWATAKSSGNFTTVDRGAGGTSTATHSSNDSVYVVYAANLFNQLKRAILAIEGYLIDAPTEKTVSSGELTVTSSRHKVQPESGTSDDIDTISGMSDNSILVMYVSDAGTDTLTLKHGTGNLSCPGGADVSISTGYITCFKSGSTVFVSGGGGGSGDVLEVQVFS